MKRLFSAIKDQTGWLHPRYPFPLFILMGLLWNPASVRSQDYFSDPAGENSGLVAQTTPATTVPTTTPGVAPSTGTPGTTAPGGSTASPGTGALPLQSGLNGFADSPWMSTYSEVKNQLKNLATSATTTERVVILREERNRYILVKRNGILYRYSFYKTPINVARLENHQLTEEEWDMQEALLYHVKVMPPFLDSKLVENRLQSIYGPPSKTTVSEETQDGAQIWQLQGGYVFQWYEPYHGKPYTRTIDYLSEEMAKKIMKEYADYFDSREKQILKDLILR